ncbi:hypothetical protein FPOA_12439 [Fusarium poae]|uniref:GrpB domain protein n=1 Tax=Fusarium poae TaxID=36050 RepID=A0A1B8A915_FUSPO|nr:hypothetical protein FPOA_13642 [Fusarium poae]OBS15570.1 hypothetical protein FPOA_13639 [Fusarium poae]OBS16974.1 hypothetical protein FPOA_12439 [Fusarium poae]
MTPTIEELLKEYDFDPSLIDRVALRKYKQPIAIVEPDPKWPEHFARAKTRIESAIGDTAVSINHVGSTSVPDINDEASYANALEAAGFHFLVREPGWHGHRLFCDYEPVPTNLHVWGPGCPEVVRHRIFTDWLRKNEDDRKAYENIKREAAKASVENGEDVMEYNNRKQNVIREILQMAFKDLGYL